MSLSEVDEGIRKISESRRIKKRSWVAATLVLVVALIVTGTALLLKDNKELNAISAAKVMKPWCTGKIGVVEVLGHKSVMKTLAKTSGFLVEDDSAFSDVLLCPKGNSGLFVFFFPTLFDENQWLTTFSNGITTSGIPGNAPVFIGHEWVAVLIWRPKDELITEGQAVQWVTNAFGVNYRFKDFPVSR